MVYGHFPVRKRATFHRCSFAWSIPKEDRDAICWAAEQILNDRDFAFAVAARHGQATIAPVSGGAPFGRLQRGSSKAWQLGTTPWVEEFHGICRIFWWDAEASSDVYFLYFFVCIVWSNCSQKQVLFFKHLVSTCLDRPFELILSRLSTKDRGTNMQRRYSIPCSLAKVFEGSKPISYVRWPNLSYIFIPSMNGMAQ